MKTTTCRSCGATIFFAKTAGGKSMPLDAKPKDRGLVVEFDEDGGARVVNYHVDVYATHFETCPNASSHRRRT